MLFPLLLAAGPTWPRHLDPATAEAWERYSGVIRLRMEARWEPGGSFLWTDEAAGRLERLRSGEAIASPAGGRSMLPIPGGLIHHWIGAVFIPGASLAGVLASVRDYDRYPENFPDVVGSRLVSRAGSMDRFTTLERHKAMHSWVAFDADISVVYTELGKGSAYSVAHTTRLQQIQNYGGDGQRKLAPDAPGTYLWRLDSIARYEEREGGVIVEMESIALSPNIPAWLRWMVAPFVRSAAADSMTDRLRQTRDAVLRKRDSPDRVSTGM